MDRGGLIPSNMNKYNKYPFSFIFGESSYRLPNEAASQRRRVRQAPDLW
jgi:hypothetical protein